MKDYVDVRGVWPTYINGMIAVTLVGKSRGITIEDAREVVKAMQQ